MSAFFCLPFLFFVWAKLESSTLRSKSDNSVFEVVRVPSTNYEGDIPQQISSVQQQSSIREELSQWFSVFKWLPDYDINNLRNDMVVGATIGVIVICQTMAHASIAKVHIFVFVPVQTK